MNHLESREYDCIQKLRMLWWLNGIQCLLVLFREVFHVRKLREPARKQSAHVGIQYIVN